MDTILIAGVESVVGANLAASLSRRYRVVGVSSSPAVAVADCESLVCPVHEADAVRRAAVSVGPDWIIDCGQPAESSWPGHRVPDFSARAVTIARNWAAAAAETECRLVLISSDAVFTGPWMFHDEDSDGHCGSEQAATIRSIEKQVTGLCADALVIRTNAYGWLPAAGGTGWIEQTLATLEAGRTVPVDPHRHATPILAADLAEILHRALEAELSGTYHIAGAERTNPAWFVQQLADVFDLPYPLAPPAEALDELPTGFGGGETSLQTKKIRKALAVPMPTLSEGLTRLHEQYQNGFRDRFDTAASTVHDKVA